MLQPWIDPVWGNGKDRQKQHNVPKEKKQFYTHHEWVMAFNCDNPDTNRFWNENVIFFVSPLPNLVLIAFGGDTGSPTSVIKLLHVMKW